MVKMSRGASRPRTRQRHTHHRLGGDPRSISIGSVEILCARSRSESQTTAKCRCYPKTLISGVVGQLGRRPRRAPSRSLVGRPRPEDRGLYQYGGRPSTGHGKHEHSVHGSSCARQAHWRRPQVFPSAPAIPSGRSSSADRSRGVGDHPGGGNRGRSKPSRRSSCRSAVSSPTRK